MVRMGARWGRNRLGVTGRDGGGVLRIFHEVESMTVICSVLQLGIILHAIRAQYRHYRYRFICKNYNVAMMDIYTYLMKSL